jgi:hypothetical protein
LAVYFHYQRLAERAADSAGWQIAGEAVEELQRYGGWKALDDEAPTMTAATNSY